MERRSGRENNLEYKSIKQICGRSKLKVCIQHGSGQLDRHASRFKLHYKPVYNVVCGHIHCIMRWLRFNLVTAMGVLGKKAIRKVLLYVYWLYVSVLWAHIRIICAPDEQSIDYFSNGSISTDEMLSIHIDTSIEVLQCYYDSEKLFNNTTFNLAVPAIYYNKMKEMENKLSPTEKGADEGVSIEKEPLNDVTLDELMQIPSAQLVEVENIEPYASTLDITRNFNKSTCEEKVSESEDRKSAISYAKNTIKKIRNSKRKTTPLIDSESTIKNKKKKVLEKTSKKKSRRKSSPFVAVDKLSESSSENEQLSDTSESSYVSSESFSQISRKYVFKDSMEYFDSINTFNRYKVLSMKDIYRFKPTQAILCSYAKNKSRRDEIYFSFGIGMIREFKKIRNIWISIYTAKKRDARRAIFLIKYLVENPEITKQIFKNYNMFYYNRFIKDLYKYMLNEIPTCYCTEINSASYYNRAFSRNNIMKIPLGDIYIRKGINLWWHAESMLVIIIEQNKLNLDSIGVPDISRIKRQIQLILSIPEIYEDLFYIPYSLIEDTQSQILLLGNIEPQHRLFCIIQYLYGKIHNSTIIKIEASRKIQVANRNYSLHTYSDIDMYNLVYKIFTVFYRHSKNTYKTYINEKIKEIRPHVQYKSRARSMYKLNYLYMKEYTGIPANNILVLKGKDSIIDANFSVCTLLLEYSVLASHDKRLLDKITSRTANYENIFYDSVELSHSHHYHVQFIDNHTHRVYIIHLPFFVFKNTRNVYKYHYIHTISDIVEHIKKTFNIRQSKKSSFSNNVYPFKYSKSENKWSMIMPDTTSDKKCKKTKKDNDMEKTIEEMANSGFTVVFYYIKENLQTTEFIFAQLNPLGADVLNNYTIHSLQKKEINQLCKEESKIGLFPRIPLFLPKLMISATYLGPYVLKSEKYHINILTEYKDLVPIEFSNWLEVPTHANRRYKPLGIIDNYKNKAYYYSDFSVLDINSPYEDCDCYSMNIVQSNINNYSANISWRTRIQHGIEDYTNYHWDLVQNATKCNNTIENNIQGKRTKKVLSCFLSMLQKKHVSLDMFRYGICIYTKLGSSRCQFASVLCPDFKNRINNLVSIDNNPMYERLSPLLKKNIHELNNLPPIDMSDISNISKVTITVKNINYMLSKLGIHYDIFDVFFRPYN
ncbi:hypothetical protein NEPAR04_0780 [Nematocida parisii]|nr:hypothetical protein NEPAR08_0781 [Nematocida parisii]KAI5127656.1 hypothetical protein NEPAR03_1046 [Nematocida parisii]KAI5141209.1 hypothetical protein NEPAR04_0780 [Nematocida parisii]